MTAIRAENTKPELRFRKLLHRLGYRYRVHVASLPGTPDIVFPRRRKVIFIHGCFWHRHRCKAGRSTPATRRSFWLKKLNENVSRDHRTLRELRRLGWSPFVAWECQLRPARLESLLHRVELFLR